jgi:hypothetical protein
MTQAAAFSEPGVEIRAITPSNSTDLTGCKGFFTTDAGNVAVKTVYGASADTAVTIADCPVGQIIPLRITRIMSTNTTATQVYGLF